MNSNCITASDWVKYLNFHDIPSWSPYTCIYFLVLNPQMQQMLTHLASAGELRELVLQRLERLLGIPFRPYTLEPNKGQRGPYAKLNTRNAGLVVQQHVNVVSLQMGLPPIQVDPSSVSSINNATQFCLQFGHFDQQFSQCHYYHWWKKYIYQLCNK